MSSVDTVVPEHKYLRKQEGQPSGDYGWEGLLTKAVLYNSARFRELLWYHDWSSYPYSFEVVRCDPGQMIQITSGCYESKKRHCEYNNFYYGSTPAVVRTVEQRFPNDQGHYVHMEVELTGMSLVVVSRWTCRISLEVIDELTRERDWARSNFHERFTFYVCATAQQIEDIAFALKRKEAERAEKQRSQREPYTVVVLPDLCRDFAIQRHFDLQRLGFSNEQAAMIIRETGPALCLEATDWIGRCLLATYRPYQHWLADTGKMERPVWPSTCYMEGVQKLLATLISGAVGVASDSTTENNVGEFLRMHNLPLPGDLKGKKLLGFLKACQKILKWPIQSAIIPPPPAPAIQLSQEQQTLF